MFLANLTTAALVPIRALLRMDRSMFPSPCCTLEGREPKCMGWPGLRVKGAGDSLGDLSPSLQKHAEQPETSGVPWPFQRAESGVSVLLGQHRHHPPLPRGNEASRMLTANQTLYIRKQPCIQPSGSGYTAASSRGHQCPGEGERVPPAPAISPWAVAVPEGPGTVLVSPWLGAAVKPSPRCGLELFLPLPVPALWS